MGVNVLASSLAAFVFTKVPGLPPLDDVGRVGVYLGASHPEWKWNRILSYATLRAGVEKLTDDDPPLIPGSVAANTDPSQYDLLGRRFYVSASYRF